ncbi:MAG TPA: NAD-dependent epimerase/dehydratase family protein [Ferruginibacter sp.]|nr:NAD-dependent epimerase/dehydratase family protein [Ferruginibacter sp.]HRE62426.1 NAD-dependent epimerase/dehydratase family protein [Ferruginibacter sp.]
MILVTGGSGLLGKVLTETLLSQGKAVKAIYNKTALPNFDNALLQQEQCDMLDVIRLEEVMEGVEYVYHCAGLVSFNKKDVQQLYQINVEGTANIVNACVNAGVKKLVHVSSVAALGRIRENEPIHEKMVWTPQTSNSRYGQSKFLGEMEVWRGVAEGLQAVVVNPTIILGAGDWNTGSTAIFKSVYNEFPWFTTGTTGFVDVEDVANAMIALMESEISGEKFILSGHNESYQNVFNAIADGFNKKHPYKKVTPLLAKLVSIVESIKSSFTGKPPLVTKETAKTAMAIATFDNSKLLKFFPGFSYTPLQQTITKTCKLLQQKLNSE